MKIGKALVFLIASVIVAGFLISGFSIGVDPRSHSWLALFSMTFPVWIAAMVLITLIVVFSRSRKSVIMLIVAWIAGAGNVYDFSPINFSRSSSDSGCIKIMTYNVFMFQPAESDSLYDYNRTLSSIIKSGADIVAVQEAVTFDSPNKRAGITSLQCDSIKERYPYRHYNSDGLALLSVFPFEPVELPYLPSGTAQFSCYKIDSPNRQFYLYNIHLQSFGLKAAERKTYLEMTDGEVSRQILAEAKHDIVPKVKVAMRSHAEEAELLVADIKQTAGTSAPVVVCGDFNDILGSYPMRLLERECGLRDAYADGALGPTYTYHSSRLFFNIDHILYRGFGKPYYTKRLKVPSSDHYPVMTELPL